MHNIHYFTPEEYVLYTLYKYPSLFKAPSIGAVKMKVYDQLFNVIGNGVSTSQDLKKELTYKEFSKVEAEKFITSEDLYYGYSEVEYLDGNRRYIMPARGSLYIHVLDSERDNHPEIKLWVLNTPREWEPYPNFGKKYSTIYQTNFLKVVSNEWIEEAKWFYSQCGWWFTNPDNVGKYYGSFPCKNEKETQKAIEEMKPYLSKYETYEKASKAYGVSYDGDVEKFMRTRWLKELDRICKFLREVQVDLSNRSVSSSNDI